MLDLDGVKGIYTDIELMENIVKMISNICPDSAEGANEYAPLVGVMLKRNVNEVCGYLRARLSERGGHALRDAKAELKAQRKSLFYADGNKVQILDGLNVASPVVHERDFPGPDGADHERAVATWIFGIIGSTSADPTNLGRAELGAQLVEMAEEHSEKGSVLVDLLANLMHFCHQDGGYDFETELEMARSHFDTEIEEEKKTTIRITVNPGVLEHLHADDLKRMGNIIGDHFYDVTGKDPEKQALALFRAAVPIKVPDDFEFTLERERS